MTATAAPDLSIGDVTVHRVIDMDPFRLPFGFIFPQADPNDLEAHRDILADHVDPATNDVLLAVQSHLVRTGGLNILVDTCVGEMKPRPRRAEWSRRTASGYLQRLAAAGCRPEDVDVVLCTHLHVDHVGWNTQLEDGRWVPTFPRARYLMGGTDLAHWQAAFSADPTVNHGSFADSVLPILDAGQADLVAPGDAVADGATILPLPGHTPGQVGLDVETAAGTRLVICGDAIHSPFQVLRSELSSAFCSDPAAAADTRMALLARAADDDVVLIPAHLRRPGMRIGRKPGRFHPTFCACDGRAAG